MDKKTGIIAGVLVAAFAILIGVSLWQNSQGPIDYTQYDLTDVIVADENSGNFAENIDGDPNAPVKIIEYGDYQCTACAPTNPYINKLIEEYDGKVAVVFRTYVMSYHPNGTAATSAANAAALQGYWKEYKDLLYANQNEWYYSDAATRQQQFENYFEQVSDGNGDLEKFRSDMNSKEVAKKIEFDRGIYDFVTDGDGVEDAWTPMFYIDGELMDNRNEETQTLKDMDVFLDELRTKIDAKLEAMGEKK